MKLLLPLAPHVYHQLGHKYRYICYLVEHIKLDVCCANVTTYLTRQLLQELAHFIKIHTKRAQARIIIDLHPIVIIRFPELEVLASKILTELKL